MVLQICIFEIMKLKFQQIEDIFFKIKIVRECVFNYIKKETDREETLSVSFYGMTILVMT